MMLNRTPDTRSRPIAAQVCALAFLVTASAAAQSPSATVDSPPATPAPMRWLDANGRVVVRATRVTEPIVIDGRLDEPAYSAVPPIEGFIQQEPREGAPISEKTETWILFDDKNIYITCRCWDEHPERIVANDMRRDSANATSQDHFGVTLDTFNDGRNGYVFYQTAIGGMTDKSITDERSNADWNTVWDARSSRFDRGWISEMAIPFKSLRYGPGRQQTWRVNFRRFINSKNERAHLTPISAAWGTSGNVHPSLAATMVGLEVPPAARNFEVKPYAISRLTTDLLSRPVVRNHPEGDAGLDVKLGVTRGLTADFTVRTDFAQVEADEAQVNLTRFSLSFPEKRDFFLEGGGIFGFGNLGGGEGGGGDAPTIFYSRSIGLSRGRALPVIAGGRLTGKVGPWSVGALNIEVGDDAAAGAAQTNFTILRLRRDILRRSNVGGIFTRRSVSTIAPGANDVFGVDASLVFYSGLYIGGYVTRSRTETRPGNDLSYRSQLNYTSDRYGLALDRLVVEKNFNPEVGFMRRENFRRSFAQPRFSPRTVKNRYVRKWTFQGDLEYITDNDNHLESRELQGVFKADLHSSDAIGFNYLRVYDFLAEPFPISISRGVVIPAGGYSFDNAIVSLAAGQRHKVSGELSLQVGSFYGGDKKTVSYKGRVDLSPQLGLEPNISLNWVDLPQGHFTDTILGARTTFTMTPRMFVAALVQYSSSNTSFSTNLRFRWEYLPGSELFFVYTEGRSTLPPQGTELQNRGFVVKVNRLFRF